MSQTDSNFKADKKIKKHLEMTEEIYRLVKKHDRWMRIQKAWTLAKVLLVVAIIVSAWIYLPPLVRDFLEWAKKLVPLKFTA